MTGERVKEILCVLVLTVFVVLLTAGSKVSEKTAEQVAAEVTKTVDVSKLQKCNYAKFKKEFGFDDKSFDGVVYYASDQVMNVSELLIVRLSASSDADGLKSAIESRVKDKAALFKGYAPEESALLDNFVLKEKDGFIFFAVCSNSDEALSSFKGAL